VGNVERLEYAYDCNNPSWYSRDAGHMVAVRFTPLFSGQLLTIRYYMYDLSTYQSNTFKVHVMDHERNDLITPFNVTPAQEGWFDVNLSSYKLKVQESVDFYVGMEWIVDYNPDLGEDRTNPSGRSWHWNGTIWKQEEYSDFMIRAVVSTTPAFPTFRVPVLYNPVTLDGVITVGEWTDANVKNVTLERDGITYKGTVYLKHIMMWMCIQVWDSDEDAYPSPGDTADTVMVCFDANENITLDAGDDIAVLKHDDIRMDGTITKTAMEEDEKIGGINNVDGASDWEAGVYTFELVKPLNSGDLAGNDIAISPGEKMRVTFAYMDASEPPGPPPYIDFMLSFTPYLCVFPIHWEGYTFNVTISSNSTVSNFNFSQPDMQISFQVTGYTGKTGYCNVTIPRDLLQGEPWIIYLNNTEYTAACSITGNKTHTYIYIPYTHSTNTIRIKGTWAIPEFPYTLALSVFTGFLIIVVTLSKKVYRKCSHT